VTSRSKRPLTERDHTQGPIDAPAELLEYGDYQCPLCKAAVPVVKRIQAEFGPGLRFAFRHFPLIEIHPHAEEAAEAAEAAHAQGQFWPMHDVLFENSPHLDLIRLLRFAMALDLDLERFRRDLWIHRFLPRVLEDSETAVVTGVRGTPTFFMNGVRYERSLDPETMIIALRRARRAAP
jgi:protein-disulfide isomerase